MIFHNIQNDWTSKMLKPIITSYTAIASRIFFAKPKIFSFWLGQCFLCDNASTVCNHSGISKRSVSRMHRLLYVALTLHVVIWSFFAKQSYICSC